MELLMARGPTAGCPPRGEAPPLRPLPSWADSCTPPSSPPGAASYGLAGALATLSVERGGFGAWWSIVLPALLAFPCFIVNGTGPLRPGEAAAAALGLLAWLAAGVDHVRVLITFRRCMDPAFVVLNAGRDLLGDDVMLLATCHHLKLNTQRLKKRGWLFIK